jgi:DNA adenine methylase
MQINNDVKRPIFQYFGGKWRVAPCIISHMPMHRVYVEPFGGGGSVLLRKPRCDAEVYNDLDSEVVNVFQVLRDHPKEFLRALDLTPFSREEYELACKLTEDDGPLERARKTAVRAFFGFASQSLFVCDGSIRKAGFRAGDMRIGSTHASQWSGYVDALEAVIDRLKGVNIEHRDAMEIIPVWDSITTCYYVDPPYMASLRRTKSLYAHELTEEQHVALLQLLRQVQGSVLLSGYDSALYNDMLSDWERFERDAIAQGGVASGADIRRTDVLWVKPAFS